MESRILTGFECANSAVWKTVDPHAFKYRVLVEGDSWMGRCTLFAPNLLPYLAKLFDKFKQSVLFIKIARLGDTMATKDRSGEFGKRQDLTLITSPLITGCLE
jgi:hypothetical protein